MSESAPPTPAVATFTEAARLAELEQVIQTGQQTFLAVGNALTEIRHRQLYKQKGFGSFAEYVETVWGFKKSYGYQLVAQAEMFKALGPSVSTIVENWNPSQVRELAKIPQEKRETVIKTAVTKSRNTGQKLTAKTIAEAAKPEPVTPVSKESKSVDVQLRELWEMATPSQRESFIEWIESSPAGRALSQFKCVSCDETFENDHDGVSLYHCENCDIDFTELTSANENHQCPDCNKFGRKVSDCGCPSCGGGELVPAGGDPSKTKS